jgi:hypothetical protein
VRFCQSWIRDGEKLSLDLPLGSGVTKAEQVGLVIRRTALRNGGAREE